MHRSRAVLSQLLLAVCLCHAVGAQPQSLVVGARVRVTMPRPGVAGYVGIVERVSADTLYVGNRIKVITPFVLDHLSRLELSRGNARPKWSRTAPLWMPLVGGAVGAIGGAAKPASRESPKDASLVIGAVGASLGLIAGAFMWAAVETEKWETVPTRRGSRTSLTPSLYVAPTIRRVAIGLRGAF